uniref:Endonuclease/exonuclease/phosphatase domain-containing protein n=1 Tax=Chromera velia CCMP2878 TaxID=1169474 RepID=A0A0G4HZM8_9ALVE|eukprot:Cvel_9759.t1-p1 / transcript=Cvel_9759.t1 / gene=Cvel_9759 / organism=Chromera_velia_CCMP2878 / gene_product=hypothetical protein / transcript_product=hypothetical protein / location=Cvel_scaffold571:49924-51348(-) / protein_length=475 / sequence_SO=supercontig / SO=protein_coding / is_pseudo=false
MATRLSSRLATLLAALHLTVISAVPFKVVTLNTLAQSKAEPKPTGMPSLTNIEILAKKRWLKATLQTHIADANVDFATIQEVDISEKSGEGKTESSSLDDVLAWAASNGYTAFHSQKNPKPSPKKPDDVAVVLMKATSFQTPPQCEPIGEYPWKLMLCENVIPIGSSEAINILAGHAPSSGENSNLFTDKLDKVTKAQMIIGDMNMDASELDQSCNKLDMSFLPGARFEIFPAKGSPDEALATTAKDAYIYRELSQALDNTDSFKGVPEEKATCAAIKCVGDETNECCDLTNEGDKFVDGDKVICKYASRICALQDKKNKKEVQVLAGPAGSTEAGLQAFAEGINLKTLYEEIGCADTKCQSVASETLLNNMHRTIMQEDLIAVRKPLSFQQTPSPFIFPMEMTSEGKVQKVLDDGRTKELAETRGYPNGAWPSDHFLVTAVLELPEPEPKPKKNIAQKAIGYLRKKYDSIIKRH